MRDLKQLKRSAKHFNLASGAFMPRGRARLDIHLSVSSSFDLSHPSAVYSSSYPLDAGRRLAESRAYCLRSSREWRRRVVWTSSEPKRRGRGRTRWTDIDKTGTGKVRGRQRRAKSTKRRWQDGGGGGDGGGDGLTPVCLRGANGVLQLF